MTFKNKGFSLLEISIVIIVIALITGVIVVGQSLVASSRLQAVIADADAYKKAVTLFKDKYKELPGDFSGATAIWGSDTCPPSANVVPKTATCNGNADGFIGDSTSTPIAITTSTEALRMWQHLANANFIKGTFNGATSSSSSSWDAGINTPKLAIKKAAFSLHYLNSNSVPASAFNTTYKHVLTLGAPGSAATKPSNAAILTPTDAMSLDAKIDDGKPGQGLVLSYTNDSTSPTYNATAASTCTTGTQATAATATYTTSYQKIACSLIFITGF